MDLSIVIVNYNTKKLTRECIDSIFTNEPKCKYEVILVDNNSTDGSVELFSKDKKIKFINNTENLGFAKANNIGIKSSKGEFILLLNSDTKVKKDSIDSLVSFAKNNSNVGAVGSRLLNPDGSIQESAFNFPTLSRAIRQYWFGQKNILDKYYPKGDRAVEVEVLVMAAFLITPLALKKIGFLDENYFMYFEDFDYCRKLKSNGLKIYYLPESEVIHYHGASGKNIAADNNQWKRLIPSSKRYHGLLGYYLFSFVLWSGQKISRVFSS